MPRRAIGIVRVSAAKGREGDSFASPTEQRARITEACERDGMELVAVHDEIDVSGGKALTARDGLRQAVEAIEGGEADVVVVAYFDRLVRSLRVQDDVVSRVEAAGGKVLALDFGEVTGATAAQWLSGTMIGAVSEYYRRSIRERSGEAQAAAIARGVAVWPNVPAGYVRGEDGVLDPDPHAAPAIAEAFHLRLAGATVAEVRDFLAGRGVERSYHGVQAMLGSRTYLGELHFGQLVNLAAHEAIVDREVWEAVQKVRVHRGRRPKSDRLLARLGVLRCGTCDARMVVGTAGKDGKFPLYRCPPTGDCPQRVTVSAVKVEEAVTAKVRAILSDAEGTASAESHAREVVAKRDAAQAELDAAIRVLSVVGDEPAAVARIAELRQVRDDCQAEVDQLGPASSSLTVRADADWDLLSLDARRALIRATIERVSVAPGRGVDRISIVAFGE